MKKIDFNRLLYVLIIIEIFNLGYFIYYFLQNGYLPSPFIWDKSNTYMDFYNPLFWVIKDEFYASYNSVYPALNYFFLKIFSVVIDRSYVVNPFQLRDDSLGLSIFLILMSLFIITIAVNIGEWKKVKEKKLIIFLALALSSPVLYSLERGNLIFLGLFFLALYLNACNPWAKALFFGLLVNIKPYFYLLLILDANIYRFNWLALGRNILCSFIIFFGLGWLAEVDFIKFFSSYLGFTSGSILSWDGYVAMPNTLATLIFIKKTFMIFAGGGSYTFWDSLFKVLMLLAPLLLLAACLLRPLKKNELCIGALIFIANFSPSTGGYIYLIYILLIPYLLDCKEYKILIYFILLIFCLPFDWVKVVQLNFPIPFTSYLGDNNPLIDIPVWVSLSSIIRPILNFSIMVIFLFKLIQKYGVLNQPSKST